MKTWANNFFTQPQPFICNRQTIKSPWNLPGKGKQYDKKLLLVISGINLLFRKVKPKTGHKSGPSPLHRAPSCSFWAQPAPELSSSWILPVPVTCPWDVQWAWKKKRFLTEGVWRTGWLCCRHRSARVTRLRFLRPGVTARRKPRCSWSAAALGGSSAAAPSGCCSHQPTHPLPRRHKRSPSRGEDAQKGRRSVNSVAFLKRDKTQVPRWQNS